VNDRYESTGVPTLSGSLEWKAQCTEAVRSGSAKVKMGIGNATLFLSLDGSYRTTMGTIPPERLAAAGVSANSYALEFEAFAEGREVSPGTLNIIEEELVLTGIFPEVDLSRAQSISGAWSDAQGGTTMSGSIMPPSL
jgi:hypothetical protein